MSTKANRVNLTGVCPHCHEAVEVELSKMEVKQLLQGFKMSGHAASILAEKHIQLKYETELTMTRLQEIIGKLTGEKKEIVEKAMEILLAEAVK